MSINYLKFEIASNSMLSKGHARLNKAMDCNRIKGLVAENIRNNFIVKGSGTGLACHRPRQLYIRCAVVIQKVYEIVQL